MVAPLNLYRGIVGGSVIWISFVASSVDAFIRASPVLLASRRVRHYHVVSQSTRSNQVVLSMSVDDDEDNEEEDDIDPGTLGDWRAFRMNLAETGIRTPNDDREDTNNDDDDGTDTAPTSSSSSSAPAKRPKSVSRKNEEILKSQSEDLAEEYLRGVWAHEIGELEVGGLVCRLPIEAEILRLADRSPLGQRLQRRLELSGDAGSTSGGNVDAPYYAPDDDEPANRGASSFSPLAAKTMFWFRGAQSLVKQELQKVTDLAEDGAIDASKLSQDSKELLNMYLDNQETWQEVGLVISKDEQDGSATSVVINRPMALKLTERLAQLVLFGTFSATSTLVGMRKTGDETGRLVTFLTAFENECAVYVGGPDHQELPATMIHGIRDLEGAREISPGTNIYEGGIDAAVKGVVAGQYRALDFRFFVGRHSYRNGDLEKKVNLGKYQPIACARALALKQCISLPKPLWNEVLELCGGELKEISNLELMKRDDVEIEEVFDEDEDDYDEGL